MMKKIVFGLLVIVLVFSPIISPVKMVSAHIESYPGAPELFPTEHLLGYLTAEKMPVMVFPLNKDFFYNYYEDAQMTIPASVRTYELTGVELGYNDLYLAPDPDNPDGYVRYTVLYHTTGTRLIAIGMYDRGDINSFGKYVPTVKYYSGNIYTGTNNPDTEHSVLGDFYPNKILNDLEAAQAILDYQTENGPFVAGREYSMFDILKFKERKGYLLGKTSSGSLVTGGGVCVVVTNWMKILSLSGAKIIEKWEHPDGQKYFENPVGAEELPIAATDATVDWPNYDLRWVQKETAWVVVSAAVMPDGDKLESEYGEEVVKFDALEIITLRFTKDRPDLSTDKLEALQNAYIAYREGEAGAVPLFPGASRLLASETWKRGDNLSDFIARIIPEERIARFSDDLKGGDPLLASLAELEYYANKIDPASTILMGKYLRTTPWYTHELERLGNDPVIIERFEQSLNHFNDSSNLWPNQKIQCYGLGILLGGMDEHFANIGGVRVNYAADLVPESIRTGEKIVETGNGYQVRVVTTLEEVRVGDFGVRYNTKVGHVFAVVGKKVVEGETVLLIASANQARDGKIALFEVDNSNFDAVFGIPIEKKVVLRRGG